MTMLLAAFSSILFAGLRKQSCLLLVKGKPDDIRSQEQPASE